MLTSSLLVTAIGRNDLKPHFATRQLDPAGLTARLLDWFAGNARDLPWRRTTSPYAIWVSEIMLQQTQVKTVIPYFERWMKALPGVRALAEADLDLVLKLWEGLGYYTRARNLQKAAQIIMRDHGGRFPENFEAVLALPGIGRYTAGAVCSIAFGQPTPILDGNVVRVLSRLFGVVTPAKEKRTVETLWGLAEALVRSVPESSSEFNQSLMELGATVCLPRQPLCGQCPVRELCFALREGKVESLPNVAAGPAATLRRVHAFVLETGGKFLLVRRPEGTVNGGLWEFPNIEVAPGSDPKASARGLFGVEPLSIELAHQVRHTITRYRITVDVFHVRTARRPKPAKPDAFQWTGRDGLESLAFPSAHRQIANRLLAGDSAKPRRRSQSA